MTVPKRIPLQSPIRQLRVSHYFGTTFESYWRIWLTANGDFTLGTFIQLCDNGDINRVTWHEDGTETIFKVNEEIEDGTN
jgi:hypothetical protein